MQARTGLEPGDQMKCEICSQTSTAVSHGSWLECEECGYQLQEYDTSHHDRVPTDEYGMMTGRGPSTRSGKRIRGSVIRGSDASHGSRGKWNRLSRIDRTIEEFRPSRSKGEAAMLIRTHGGSSVHIDRSLELLDVGWPDASQTRSSEFARENPLWKPAHPHGVGASAAVCLHLSAAELGFDSKFSDWVSSCIQNDPKANSHAFRSLKHMRRILSSEGRQGLRPVEEAELILQRANLSETEYRSIAVEIREAWTAIRSSGENAANHTRQVLAALCQIKAKEAGLRVRPKLIRERFNVNRGYQGWIPICRDLMKTLGKSKSASHP